jgi:glycosyltransferase involved in cell wall biosynthesis
MTFELFCPVYNEEYLLPYTVDFYRKKLGKDNIIFNFYDNGSTDKTVEVAKKLGCNVGVYETGGQVRDDLLMQFKNTIWKKSTADFVIVIDCDEWVDIIPELLIGKTIQGSIGYNMIGDGTETPDNMTMGIRHTPEDKTCVFSPFFIKEVNYTAGAHQCNPVGDARWAEAVKLYHIKFVSADYVIQKYAESKQRLSDINKKYGWGFQYTQTQASIRNMHQCSVRDRVKVRDI